MNDKAKGETASQGGEKERGIAPRVLRARAAAEGAIEQGNWDAAMLACGKVLEEIAKAELPYNERGGTLGQLLEKLPKEVDLVGPVRQLSAELKHSKGLATVFDLEKEATPELATAGLELVDAFLTYLYGFREALERLVALSQAQAKAKPGAQPEGQGQGEGGAFERFASSSTFDEE